MKPGTPYHDQKVRFLTNPYGVVDWLKVVKNNLRMTTTSHHSDLTDFVDRDTTVDASVTPKMTIAYLGDLMPVRNGPFHLGEELTAFLTGVDYIVANFEGVLWFGGGEPPKVTTVQRHPDLRVLDAFADIVAPERLVLSVANNHSADYGYDNHLKTVEALRDRGHVVIGTIDEPSAVLDGSVQITGVTRWTNQDHTYLPFLPAAEHLADEGHEMNILFPHWGNEMETHPRPETVDSARHLLSKWDAIIGHHSHVPNPVSTLTVDGEHRLVAFSLGQASSDLPYPLYRSGVVVKTTVGPSANGKWAVGDSAWRFLKLRQEETFTGAELSGRCRFFPEASTQN